jgi:hypothetical protein
MEAQIAAARATFGAEEAELLKTIQQDETREQALQQNRNDMALRRRGSASRTAGNGAPKKAGGP